MKSNENELRFFRLGDEKMPEKINFVFGHQKSLLVNT